MSTPNHDPKEFDWKAAESDLGEVVDLEAARQRRESAAVVPSEVPDDVVPAPAGDAEVLEGEIVAAQVTDPPPELKQWAWAVGWKHKARRLWTYKYRYLWNTIVVLGAWGVRATGWWFRGIARSVTDFFDYVDDRQALAIAD